MTELNHNLSLALDKVNIALSLMNEEAQGVANIIDTKAEVFWKLGKIDEAIQIIDKAITNVGQRLGYDYIFDAASGGIVYALDAHNLTEDVLDELRKVNSTTTE